jgi:hypothetical protein
MAARAARSQQDRNLVDQCPGAGASAAPDAAQAGGDGANDELQNKLVANVAAETRFFIEKELLSAALKQGALNQGAFEELLAACQIRSNRLKSDQELADVSPSQYIDVTLPLASAAFTSLAWQAVTSKFPAQIVLLIGTGCFATFSVTKILSQTCPGFDRQPNLQYASSSWDTWGMRVPCGIGCCYMWFAILYFGWMKGHHGRILRHAIQIPFLGFSAWAVVAAVIFLVINPTTQDSQERTCLLYPGGYWGRGDEMQYFVSATIVWCGGVVLLTYISLFLSMRAGV